MLRSRQLVLGAVAITTAVLALPVAAAAQAGAGGPTVATIYHRAQLPVSSGQLETVVVTCPAGYVATSGTSYPLPPGVGLLRSAGTGPRRIFLLAPSSSGATEVTLVVTCVRTAVAARGRKFTIRFRPVRPIVRTVLPNRPVRVRVRCAADAAPVGSVAAVTSTGRHGRAALAPGATGTRSNITSHMLESLPFPGGRGWTLQSAGPGPEQVEVGLICSSRTGVRRDGRRRITVPAPPIARRLLNKTVPPGVSGVEISCPRGFAPLEPVWDLGEPGVQVLAAHPDNSASAVRIQVANLSGSDRALRAGALCRRGSRRIVGGP